jgi:TrmH family RNA methyltransferase
MATIILFLTLHQQIGKAVTITSRQNPLVKQLRQLHQAKGRREQNRFLLEGTHLLETACAVDCSLDTACYTAAWRERYPQLWQEVAGRAKRLELVAPAVLEAIATTVHPDGIVATASRERHSPQLDGLRLGLLLEGLQDPGNLGTILRTAVATGVEGVWLGQDSADPDSPKALRASTGAWFRLAIATCGDLSEPIRQAQARGIQVIATSPQASESYWDLDWQPPSLVLLGNEGAGLSPELLVLADRQVSIPVGGGVESLNVAIAGALLLYEVQRQRRGNS